VTLLEVTEVEEFDGEEDPLEQATTVQAQTWSLGREEDKA